MTEIEKRLKAAGRASAKAADARTKAAKELREAIQAAVDAGMTKTEIARLTGINRVTVYQLLD